MRCVRPLARIHIRSRSCVARAAPLTMVDVRPIRPGALCIPCLVQPVWSLGVQPDERPAVSVITHLGHDQAERRYLMTDLVGLAPGAYLEQGRTARQEVTGD